MELVSGESVRLVFSGIVEKFRQAVSGRVREPARTPEATRLYAVGDIHGRDDLLAELLDQIAEDAASLAPGFRRVLVFLGDYVDRGLQSSQVIERLVNLALPGFEIVFLKGNHEQAMLQFLEDAQFGKTWKYYGGLETLHSYGVTELTLSDDPRDFERAREHFAHVLPVTHLDFLGRLQVSFECGDYFFAHAGVRPGLPLHRQIEEDLLWIRNEFLESDTNFGKIVVHGHTPKEEVEFRANRVGVDTGAYMTGVLTALMLEGSDMRVIQTGRLLKHLAKAS